jgi:hypothetical protein
MLRLTSDGAPPAARSSGDAEALDVIRDGQEIQRLAALQRLAHVVHDIAAGEPVCGVGIDAHRAAQVRIEGIARVQVQVAVIRLAHRIDADLRHFGGRVRCRACGNHRQGKHRGDSSHVKVHSRSVFA